MSVFPLKKSDKLNLLSTERIPAMTEKPSLSDPEIVENKTVQLDRGPDVEVSGEVSRFAFKCTVMYPLQALKWWEI